MELVRDAQELLSYAVAVVELKQGTGKASRWLATSTRIERLVNGNW